MNGKVCLVTGATSGIGEATARGLAALGARVLIHGRDRDTCARAARQIAGTSGNPHVEAVHADLTSLADVRALAHEVNERVAHLDVLINNAGGSAATRTLTPDGFERTFAVNHLAPFLLTNLLLDRLKASAPARIVNVSSTMHRTAHIDFDDLQMERRYGSMRAYGQSKLANVLFTRALARRLTGSGVTANALHPGAVRTKILGGITGALSGLVGLFLLSPEEGARTSIFLATSPDVAETSGLYFVKCKPASTSPIAMDDNVAERLWQVSAHMTGITT